MRSRNWGLHHNFYRFNNMDFRLVQRSNDFMVPTGQDLLDATPSTEDWFEWGESGFAKDGFPRNYSGTSETENMANLNYDTRVSHVKESKVPQVYMGERTSSSSACEDGLLPDCTMRASDDFFHDLPDFEMQNSMQNMNDIFLNSFLEDDIMHLENPYESLHIPASMHPPLNLKISILEDSETLMKDSSRRENSDPNFIGPCAVEPSPIPESLITTVVDEPVCTEATVLQELENVMLQLNRKSRICIRDALYRLANRSKEQHNLNLCHSTSPMGWPSYSEFYCATSRKELPRSLEPKTNAIDRVIATLMFDKLDHGPPAFPSAH